MRKFNAVLSLAILILFLIHGIFGSFLMLGPGSTAVKSIAWIDMGLIALHAAIGVKLTVDTLIIQRKSGVSYFKENKLFWARRISGFAVMALLFFHLTAFGKTADGVYRLYLFDFMKLLTQILLVAAVGTHVISNLRPMLISFGIKSFKDHIGEILIVISLVILFMAAALAVYFLRWKAF